MVSSLSIAQSISRKRNPSVAFPWRFLSNASKRCQDVWINMRLVVMLTLADNVTLSKGRSQFALFYGFAAFHPGFSDFPVRASN